MRHWEASWAIRWLPLCFLSTEVVVHIFFEFFGSYTLPFLFPPSRLPLPSISFTPPSLYAVMQADVGLFCCVLLSLTPPT